MILDSWGITTDVTNDIDKWHDKYRVDEIFIDEVSNLWF
jgi:hypothetical protein